MAAGGAVARLLECQVGRKAGVEVMEDPSVTVTDPSVEVEILGLGRGGGDKVVYQERVVGCWAAAVVPGGEDGLEAELGCMVVLRAALAASALAASEDAEVAVTGGKASEGDLELKE